MKIRTSLFGALLCLFSMPALSDPIILYTMDELGGDSYQYNFTVDNSAGDFAIEGFTIFFEFDLYANLLVTGSPGDWDGIEIQPEPAIMDDGFADWAFGLPIDVGDVLSGFSVAFDWIGLEGPPPLDQFFTINDVDFEPVFFGDTMFVNGDAEVPEPGTLGLFSLALLLMTFTSRKKILLQQQ